MSYAGKDPRSRRTLAAAEGGASTTTRRRAPAGERVLDREISISGSGIARSRREPVEAEGDLDWQHIGIFTAGALLGVAVGAGAALLFAPQSGAETRHELARRGRHLRTRGSDAWDDLRDELRYAASRGRRKLSRRVKRAMRARQMHRESNDDRLALD
jgi:gas vesicle protein